MTLFRAISYQRANFWKLKRNIALLITGFLFLLFYWEHTPSIINGSTGVTKETNIPIRNPGIQTPNLDQTQYYQYTLHTRITRPDHLEIFLGNAHLIKASINQQTVYETPEPLSTQLTENIVIDSKALHSGDNLLELELVKPKTNRSKDGVRTIWIKNYPWDPLQIFLYTLGATFACLIVIHRKIPWQLALIIISALLVKTIYFVQAYPMVAEFDYTDYIAYLHYVTNTGAIPKIAEVYHEWQWSLYFVIAGMMARVLKLLGATELHINDFFSIFSFLSHILLIRNLIDITFLLKLRRQSQNLLVSIITTLPALTLQSTQISTDILFNYIGSIWLKQFIQSRNPSPTFWTAIISIYAKTSGFVLFGISSLKYFYCSFLKNEVPNYQAIKKVLIFSSLIVPLILIHSQTGTLLGTHLQDIPIDSSNPPSLQFNLIRCIQKPEQGDHLRFPLEHYFKSFILGPHAYTAILNPIPSILLLIETIALAILIYNLINHKLTFQQKQLLGIYLLTVLAIAWRGYRPYLGTQTYWGDYYSCRYFSFALIIPIYFMVCFKSEATTLKAVKILTYTAFPLSALLLTLYPATQNNKIPVRRHFLTYGQPAGNEKGVTFSSTYVP